MTARDIIIKPLLTEKSYDGINDKKYTFIVANGANRTMVKKAVEEIFEVKVESVNMGKVLGKMKRQGRYEGMTPTLKKAIVQLKADSKPIEFFESLS